MTLLGVCFLLFALAFVTCLIPPEFSTLPVGAVKPEGWLKDQLFVQANGYSRNIDVDWPDVASSGWLGGWAEGYERLPYYLDGLVGLAVQTNDSELLHKLHNHFDYVLTHQSPEGWLGPIKGRGNFGRDFFQEWDFWPQFCILKSMIQYAEAFPEDNRVLPAIKRSLQIIDKRLDTAGLKEYSWAQHRWGDALLVVEWYYDRFNEPWLLNLASKLQRQGYDWVDHFHNFQWHERVPNMSVCHQPCHGVNNAQSLKIGSLLWRISGNPLHANNPKEAVQNLDKYHGMPSGIFSNDELYAGLGPRQGAELCTVVEYMYSLEVSAAISGTQYGSLFGDRIEKLAYNALPSTFDPSMNYHQYVQQINQVACKVAPKILWSNIGNHANLYGKAPHFGCCTANYHQGWPKFVKHIWMRQKDKVVVVLYAPSSFTAQIAGEKVDFNMTTNYPFMDGKITIKLNSHVAVPVEMLLRIPEWTKGATVTVNQGKEVLVQSNSYHNVQLDSKSELVLNIPLIVCVQRHEYKSAVSIHRGPLLFSLGLQYSKKRIDNCKKGECDDEFDFEVSSTQAWNYAVKLDAEDPEKSIKFFTKSISSIPFSHKHIPVFGVVIGRKISSWIMDEDLKTTDIIPQSPIYSDEEDEELTLVPFGSTNARIAMFPTLN